jgi:hypothetical protein
MTPEICRVSHNPERGQYADCVRACVASILDRPAVNVPHWFENPERDGENCQLNMQLWLAEQGKIAAMIGIPGNTPFPLLLAFMRDNYPDCYYMLWCNSGGDHAIVGQNDKIVHNPAWIKSPVDGPHSSGFWIVWIICTL